MSTEETLLFSSSDYNSDDLARLLELQRRQAELRDPNVEEFVLDEEEEEEEEEDDDFSVTGGSRRNNKKGPTVPDMRFEKQFEKSIESLREKGTSNMGILWSAVIKDQIIIPFLSGFTWNLCSVAWKWYRTSSRGVINAKGPAGKRFGFFKGIQHGVSEWTK
jgi:hypothetical protein